ncbi:hypothetical protein COU60_00620 [Candidatus Pacearchaeota archaeon CG10_big_fil_rev_8_21_14_0_10_34_76]|nr:MAG: hypothetical protein COU60_00620 [Candidatus Pacearchaeota archaeon CG10_big_fil_rev_8_21_14_0_10_34_76]
MYLTRAETSSKIPIPRKGTRYLARALSHVRDGVPAVIALRDMIGLAETAREVKLLIKSESLKINGKIVRDYRESIRLFNIFEAGDKKYKLTILPTGRWNFEETSSSERLCKILNKKILTSGKIQINLHDGSNLISKKQMNIGDSLLIGTDGKIIDEIPLKKGGKAFVYSGKSVGLTGTIENINEKKILIKLGDKVTELYQSHVIAIK